MQAIKRFFAILFGALAMCLVAALFAFVSMRIAIHGREVEVPNLAGKSDAEAAAIARSLGLNLSVENRFYSPAVPPNAVLSQLPVAGSRVRSGWQIRITESLGPQQSTVPDVTGTPERAATVVLRRLQLEVATVAHIPAPGPSGIVLAQSPPPNSHGMNGPDVSLLVSDEETSADLPGYVMPSLVGLTVGAASSRLATVRQSRPQRRRRSRQPARHRRHPQLRRSRSGTLHRRRHHHQPVARSRPPRHPRRHHSRQPLPLTT
jgi:beta-lactam-binding protein with PASTA domain